MPVTTRKRIGNNKAFICVRENGQLVTKPVDIFGSVRIILGKDTPDGQIAQLVYDLRQQKFGNFVKLELMTGGEYIPEFDGYKNWFPGCTTYGFLRDYDAIVYDENNEPMHNEYGDTIYVPMWGQGRTREEATVEILDQLDAVNTNQVLRQK